MGKVTKKILKWAGGAKHSVAKSVTTGAAFATGRVLKKKMRGR